MSEIGSIEIDDHYAVLGLAESATSKEIKGAFFRLVRTHTPEDDPDGFRSISQAYQVLSDPAKRAEYDRRDRLPIAATALLEQLHYALEAEDTTAARQVASELMRDHGEHAACRRAAGVAYARTGAPKSGARVFSELLKSDPTDAQAAKWLGICLKEMGKEKEALEALYRCLRLDPDDSETYMTISSIHIDADRTDMALSVLEEGIQADDQIDLGDLPLVFRKVFIHARERNWDEIKRESTRLLSAVPLDDSDACQYVASQFVAMGRAFHDGNASDLAKFAIDCALEVLPGDPELLRMSQQLQPAAEATSDFQMAHQDERLAKWTRALVWLSFVDEPEEEFQRLTGFAVEAVGRRGRKRARKDWALLKRLYPAVAEVGADLWERVQQVAFEPGAGTGGRRSRGRRAGTRSGLRETDEGFGCVQYIVIIVVLKALFLAMASC